jgi:hypothetical protein
MTYRWTLRVMVLTVLCGISAPSFASESGEEAYERGYQAFRDGKFKPAIQAFKRALMRMKPTSSDYAQVHYNLGRCVQRILETKTDVALACRGAAWFAIYLERSLNHGDPGSRDRARVGRADLKARCHAGTALGRGRGEGLGDPHAGIGEGRRTRIMAWGLTGLASAFLGGGLYALSVYNQALDDRQSARDAFESSEGDEREVQRYELRRHELRAASSGAAGWALSAVGVTVGVAAALAWFDVDAIRITPTSGGGELALGWTW